MAAGSRSCEELGLTKEMRERLEYQAFICTIFCGACRLRAGWRQFLVFGSGNDGVVGRKPVCKRQLDEQSPSLAIKVFALQSSWLLADTIVIVSSATQSVGACE